MEAHIGALFNGVPISAILDLTIRAQESED